MGLKIPNDNIDQWHNEIVHFSNLLWKMLWRVRKLLMDNSLDSHIKKKEYLYPSDQAFSYAMTDLDATARWAW
jgi:hypothetical protein